MNFDHFELTLKNTLFIENSKVLMLKIIHIDLKTDPFVLIS